MVKENGNPHESSHRKRGRESKVRWNVTWSDEIELDTNEPFPPSIRVVWILSVHGLKVEGAADIHISVVVYIIAQKP